MMHTLKAFGSRPRTDERLRLNFTVTRDEVGFDLQFAIVGRTPADLSNIKTPDLLEASARRRRDGLWSSTCFEIFYGPDTSSHYSEVNFAPSGEWNLYRFDDYRSGMRPAEDASVRIQNLELAPSRDHRTWRARVEDPSLAGGASLVLGATAVIEYQNGEREYWALAHAGSQPDFHLRESFRILI